MTPTPVRMILTWSVPPAESRPIGSFLQGLMVSTRLEPGCVSCQLTTEAAAGVVIRYVEEWRTEDELKGQLRSKRFAVLVELMEHASKRPTIEFVIGDSTRGSDYAEEIRGAGPF